MSALIRTAFVTAVTAVAVGALTGCEEQKVDQAPDGPLTSAQFHDRATKICTGTEREVVQLSQEARAAAQSRETGVEETSFDPLVTLYTGLGNLYLAQAQQLGDLEPPAELRPDVEELVAIFRRDGARLTVNPLVVMDPEWKAFYGVSKQLKALDLLEACYPGGRES